jgi:hypothetical protein
MSSPPSRRSTRSSREAARDGIAGQASPVAASRVTVRPRARLRAPQLLAFVAAIGVLVVVAAALASGGGFGPTATSSPGTTVTQTATSGPAQSQAAQASATFGPSASIDASAFRSVPLGLPLEPGRYQTGGFRPRLTFDVDDGWTTVGARFGDAEAGFDLARQARPTDRITFVWSNTVTSTGCVEDPERLRIGGGGTVPPGATQLEVPGSLPSLDKLQRDAVLAGDPWLHRPLEGPEFEERDPAAIHNRVARQVDITELRTTDCIGGQNGAAIVRRIETSSGRPDVDEWVILPEGSWARVMPAPFGTVYEEVAGELIIIIQSANRADFDAFLPIANSLLESTLIAGVY